MDDKKLEDAMAENVEKSFNDAELQDIMNEIETLEKEFVDEPTATATETTEEDAHEDKSLALSEAKDNSLQDAIDKEVASIGSEISTETEEVVEAATQSEEQVQAEMEEPLGDFEGEDLAAEVEAELAEVEEVTAEAVEEEEMVAEAAESADVVAEETTETSAEDATETMAEEVQEVVAEVEEDSMIAAAEETASEEVIDNVVAFKPAPVEAKPFTAEGSTMGLSAQGQMNLNLNFSVGTEEGHLVINEQDGLKVEVSGVQLVITEEAGCVVTMPGGIKFEIPLTGSDVSTTKKAA